MPPSTGSGAHHEWRRTTTTHGVPALNWGQDSRNQVNWS
jgi:hypothetical protein